MSTIACNGLIVTTVELKTEQDGVPITSPKDHDGKTVYFESGSTNGTRAFFLTNIKGTFVRVPVWNLLRSSYWQYTATIVSPTKASEIVADGLFCIHGFLTSIDKKLKNAEVAKDNFEEAGTYYPVPVIWPTQENELGYLFDQRSAEEAGKLFS